jgi:hypothetical protein
VYEDKVHAVVNLPAFLSLFSSQLEAVIRSEVDGGAAGDHPADLADAAVQPLAHALLAELVRDIECMRTRCTRW